MKTGFKRVLGFILTVVFITSLVFVLNPAPVSAIGNTYYVDSVGGNNNNTGTSEGAAWRTLDKVNSIPFQPGDCILFKRGCTWYGTLQPQGEGNSSVSITIDAYGVGAKPILDGNDQDENQLNDSETIRLENKSYWTIQNLMIKNTDPDPSTIELRSGIRLVANGNGKVIQGIKLYQLDITEIHGSYIRTHDTLSFFYNAAIHIEHKTAAPLARFDNLVIEKCNIVNVKTPGIMFIPDVLNESCPYFNNWDSWSTNVRIRENTINGTGGDGILVGMCNSPLVEYNTVAHTGTCGDDSTAYVAGIWGIMCHNPIFQYNECYATELWQGDGVAWDTDWGITGYNIYQYNYSHDNEGGFKIGPCNLRSLYSTYLTEDIIRYNISQNDGAGIDGCKLQLDRGVSIVYNNVFYCPNNRMNVMNTDNAWGGFYNNIVVANNLSVYPAGYIDYDNNCFYGHTGPSGDNNIIGNPLFVNPGTGGNGPGTVNGYTLQSLSPCINKGKVIVNNGGSDYWGNPLYYGSPDIGAYEHQGPSVVNNTDSSIEYAMNWWLDSNRGVGDYMDDVLATGTDNDWVHCIFNGTGIKYIAEKDTCFGDVDVYVDGLFQQTVSCYSPSYMARQTAYSITGLPAGIHTIRLFKKNGMYMNLDAFEVDAAVSDTVQAFYNDTSEDVSYYGGWSHQRLRGVGDYQDDVHTSVTDTEYAQFTFYGTNVKYIAEKDACFGNVDVYIDDVFRQTVSCYSPTRSCRQEVFGISGLAEGSHTIKLVKKSGQYMNIDGFEITRPVDMNDTAAGITYNGSGWFYSNNRNVGNYCDDVHATTDNEAYAEYPFYGTHISYIAEKDACFGDVDVYIDGVFQQTVSCYNPARVSQQAVFTKTGLVPDSWHTIRLVKKSGMFMNLDGFKVYN